jgi:integrase
MAAPLIKTETPGIYKRGSRYVFRYRDATGRQRWESTRTLKEARERKRKREVAADSGEQAETKATLHEYAREWINTYTGRTGRGFREETRKEYRRQLDSYLLRHFDERVLLKEVTPKRLQGFVAWLEREQPRRLSDATVQRIMAPVKAMFATAYELEDLRRNPAALLRLSNRDEANVRDDEDENARAMSRAQLDTFLANVDSGWRTFFWLLAATGLRYSEVIALQWRHVQLTGSNPHLEVRQRIVRGGLGAPKSRYGRRDIPLSPDLVHALIETRRASEWPRDTDYVFPSPGGTPPSHSNLLSRVLRPAADAADVPWAGFHTFRHTCASMLIAEGRDIVQVSRWLGHHDPGFTLRRYAHLMDEGVGGALEIGGCDKSAHRRPTGQRHTAIHEIAD